MRTTLLACAASTALLWVAPAYAAFEHCDTVEELTLDSWRCGDKMVPLCLALMPSENPDDPDNPGPSLFEQHCVDVHLRIHKSAETLRTDFYREPEVPIDGSTTFEAALALPSDVKWSIVGAFAGNNQMLVGTVEPKDFLGNIFGTGRCPDTDERVVGGAIHDWRNITDPEKVTYTQTSKSGNTIQTISQLREWKRTGVLPADTAIVCGARFSVPGNEYRPSGEGIGEHYVLIEEENKRLTAGRVDMLRQGKYQGASIVAEYYFNIRRQIPNLRVYDVGIGPDSFVSAGLFVKNEKLDEKHEAFCRFNQAIQKALDQLFAGSVTKVGDSYVLDDAAAAGAFHDFMRVLPFESTDIALTNSLKGALEIRSQSTDIDHYQTFRARLDFLGFARENLWWGTKPTEVQLQTFRDWFDVPDVGYIDPCTYEPKA
ncbi:MAG: hypothetical protein WDZ93_01505 [Candidatus Paceibacterota bacterium]